MLNIKYIDYVTIPYPKYILFSLLDSGAIVLWGIRVVYYDTAKPHLHMSKAPKLNGAKGPINVLCRRLVYYDTAKPHLHIHIEIFWLSESDHAEYNIIYLNAWLVVHSSSNFLFFSSEKYA